MNLPSKTRGMCHLHPHWMSFSFSWLFSVSHRSVSIDFQWASLPAVNPHRFPSNFALAPLPSSTGFFPSGGTATPSVHHVAGPARSERLHSQWNALRYVVSFLCFLCFLPPPPPSSSLFLPLPPSFSLPRERLHSQWKMMLCTGTTPELFLGQWNAFLNNQCSYSAVTVQLRCSYGAIAVHL